MIDVSTEFKTQTKKVKNQDIKLEICDGELTVKEIHMMPVHIFNALPVWKLRARRQIIAKELRYSFDGQLFKTIMKQIEINIKNAGDIKEKDVNFKYGLFIKNKYEYVNLGNYFIKDIEDSKKKNEMLVTGYDRMIRFMKIFKQSEIGLSYPCRLGKLTQRIGEICDVELYNTDFFNSDLEVSEDFFSKQDLTYRDILDKIAQVTLSTIFIKENKLYIKSVTNEVLERLDKSYVTDLVIKEKFGPLNALVLGRGDIEDNIEETDQKSIEQNGRCEIRFDENEFIEFQREKVIKEMFNQIKGLEYYAFEASDLGVLWLEPGDCIELGDREDNFYKSYYLKANITINTGIVSDSEAEMPEESNTEYKVITKEEKRTLKVERLAKKNEGLIQDLTQETTENTEKLTKHEQTIDSISDKVSHIEETTNTIEGNKTIQLGNAVAGELIELHIYGNNDVFSSLKISDDVVLSDDLYLLGDSLIVITDSKGNSKEYELGIKDVLRQKDDVYDEYVFKDGKAQIIRRINSDGTIKTKETIEDLGAFSIELFDGTNTLSIKNYIASLKAKFAIQNDMTNIYASKVEMNSAINQTAEQVDINVNKKLKSYSKTTEMNAAINVKADAINQVVKKKVGEDEIVSKINQSAEEVLIHADKLDINGKAAKFKTEINAEFGPFTKDDINRVQKIILGEIEATSDDYEKYDINKEGAINSFDLLIVSRAVYAGGYYKIKGTFEIDPYSASRSLTIHRNGASSYSVALSLFGAIFSNIYTSQLNFFRTGDGNSLVINGDLFSMEDDNENRIDLLMESYNDGTKLPALELVKRDTRTRIDSQGITTPKLTQTSLAEQKKNFEKMQDGAVDVLKNIDIYKYNLKCEKDTDKKHIGFVIGDKYNYSKEVTSLDNKGVDNYSFTSLCCKAIQELSQQVESLQNEIKILREEKFNEINRLDK